MTEQEFESYVVELAQTFGWRVAGFRPARTNQGWRTPVKYDGKGWPDLTLVHAGQRRIVFAELKVGRNKPSAEQVEWALTLDLACDDVHTMYRLWHPDDAAEIAVVLSFGRVVDWNMIERNLGRFTP